MESRDFAIIGALGAGSYLIYHFFIKDEEDEESDFSNLIASTYS